MCNLVSKMRQFTLTFCHSYTK